VRYLTDLGKLTNCEYLLAQRQGYIYSQKNITVSGESLTLTPIVRLESLAAKTLKDQSAGRVSRQVLRLVAKEKMRAELARSGGDVGNILANIYNLASEQADTRSWLTLPNQLSIAQTAMTPGNHSLWVSGHGKIDFAVSKQGLTFVYLTFINNYSNTKVTLCLTVVLVLLSILSSILLFNNGRVSSAD
jgi:hypothetical protein